VDRETFVPSTIPLDRVYSADEAIPTHLDDAGVPISSSSAPRIMAVMLEMLGVHSGQQVLEIGAGTAYNAALLSRLVGPRGCVVSIDIDPDVVEEAISHLEDAGITGVSVTTGDGWFGSEGQTFDRIIVTAECWDISRAWVDQLVEGGILVLPLWLRPGLTLAVAFAKTKDMLRSQSLAYCGFMPLRSPHASPALRAVLPSVPWDNGPDAADRRWLAVFEEATEERITSVLDLLNKPGSLWPAPSPCAGWNVRLTLEERDPICFATMLPPLRFAVGFFDPDPPGLAVLYDNSVHSYGYPRCRERLLAFLSTPRPLDVADLTIIASRQGAPRLSEAAVRISRPSIDLWVT
jgi:protein-L-isoaspartate(D-aspartate) O-methyltransferase